METGINLFCYEPEGKITVDRQIELMKEHGFGHTFLMSNSAELTDKTANKLEKAGLVIDTLHAPFRSINSIWAEGAEGDEVLRTLTDGLKRCAEYKIPVLVVHLSSKLPAPLISDAGNLRFGRLMETAATLGVTVAYENQRSLANLAAVLERFDEAGFCWDAGHEGCFTPNRQYMPIFGSRLAVVHIHDNFCVYDQDAHLLPYDGKLDFDRIARQLSEYGCKTVMLEVFRSQSHVYDDVSCEEYYARAASAAKRLAAAVEAY